MLNYLCKLKSKRNLNSEIIFFSGFILFVLIVLMLDLGVLSKGNYKVKFKEALIWTGVWVACAIGFYFFIRFYGQYIHGIENYQDLAQVVQKYKHPILLNGPDFATDIITYQKNLSLEFITGYLIEYALSIDNIFVIVLIFNAFNVREKYYKRVLFWGVLGALVMRFLFIFLGAGLIHNFEWILYVFGAFLIYSGIKLFFEKEKEEEFDVEKHPIVKFVSRFLKVFPRFVGERFFIKKDGKIWVTPLFIVLVVVEFTDVIFAVDSVPAIFSVTLDPYIVFFSNIFAIMGLRSLFFVLSNILHLFYYLKYGLAILLTYIGLKLVFHHWLKEIGFTNNMSLIIVLSILSLSIIVSLLFPKKINEAGT